MRDASGRCWCCKSFNSHWFRKCLSDYWKAEGFFGWEKYSSTFYEAWCRGHKKWRSHVDVQSSDLMSRTAVGPLQHVQEDSVTFNVRDTLREYFRICEVLFPRAVSYCREHWGPPRGGPSKKSRKRPWRLVLKLSSSKKLDGVLKLFEDIFKRRWHRHVISCRFQFLQWTEALRAWKSAVPNLADVEDDWWS